MPYLVLDPHVTHLFKVEVDNELVAHFQEVSGLSGSIEPFEIKEGGLNALVHKFATRANWGDITFKRGFIDDLTFWEWIENSTVNSLTPRKNGRIIMHWDDGTVACEWRFFRAFPIKYEGPQFNAGSSAIAIESLTLAVEWLELHLEGEPEPPEPPPPPPPPPPEPPPSELEGVEFDVNKSNIRPGSDQTAIDNWAEYLNSKEDKPPVFVTGHTSTTGSASHNKTLSQNRANTVKQELISQGVTNPITAIGYGEERLKVQTADGVENQANRRVEIYENTNPYDGGGNPWG